MATAMAMAMAVKSLNKLILKACNAKDAIFFRIVFVLLYVQREPEWTLLSF